jgi:biotin carboxyl carrier protein
VGGSAAAHRGKPPAYPSRCLIFLEATPPDAEAHPQVIGVGGRTERQSLDAMCCGGAAETQDGKVKLHAVIGNAQVEIQISDEGGRVFAELDGRRYELEVHESGAGGFVLISKGQVFDCRVEGRAGSGNQVDVIVGTRSFAITLTDRRKLSNAASPSAHGDNAARIIAPMPGKVVRVLVEVGSEVATGDGILVVEAMKMQNEMKSPKAGTVVALNIQTGATVNGGDVLAVIE